MITGLSGSGKSSLAFDTLYAEGQRRYVESLSAYARQFLQLMDKPDVDVIEGLSPAISIEQKATSHNPRSTVGTVTEIHDYLRLLFARAGTPYCPNHALALQAQSVSQMVDATLALPAETRLMVLAPVVRDRKGEFVELFEQMQAQGYVRFRVDGATVDAADVPKLKKAEKHDIDVVIDRIKVPAIGDAAAAAPLRQRLAESFEAALRIADGRALAVEMDETVATEHLYSSKFACPLCDYSLPELEPRLFSFNSPVGACPTCDGLGVTTVFDADRVVAFPSLSLASGAVKGWDRRNKYTFSLLESVAGHFGFDLDTPFEELPAEAREVLLRGSGEVEIEFVYQAEGARGKPRVVKRTPSVRRHPAQPRAALARDRLGGGARGAGAPAERQAVPRLPRHAPARRGEERVPGRRRQRRQGADLPGRALHAARGAGLVREPGARRRQGRDRRQGDPRDLLAPEVPQRRRPQLPEPRPQRRDALGRRGAADPARVADRLGADRRDVRPRRAVDRPAPARQRAPDRHALSPARHRQQRHRRRARRGSDPRRRPRDRHGPGRRRPRRPGDGAGPARGRRRGAGIADRPLPLARAAHPGAQARACAAGRGRGCASSARAATT